MPMAIVKFEMLPDKYRFMRSCLEVYLQDLREFYSENSKSWGDQDPDRIGLNNRIAQLSELLRDM
ncbi:MAG TPA: hypothetical protein VH187_05665 [Scandinavium sp.]|uniref:hypothetical protein n=1 Tax=Scandinavium sp. TaxID=2830653 RepID=UPI002E31A0AF|nr:hypothetical protein [Scandinavium sp.]HEX4500647.1 hypothetical protein [Scandinavium sp.]